MLMILVTILDGTWCLEQPGNSYLEFYPLFRNFIAALFESQGDSAVTTNADSATFGDSNIADFH